MSLSKFVIFVRSSGEMASGTVVRLAKAGFSVIASDKSAPSTVRQLVSFSTAVTNEAHRITIDGVTGILCDDIESIKKVLSLNVKLAMPEENEDNKVKSFISKKNIFVPLVCTDRDASSEEKIFQAFSPSVIIDATISKNNAAKTNINEAPLVIGYGPGLVAGKDAHCVIETNRGHLLGDIIWKGEAAPNTHIPGDIDGFTFERVLRSPVKNINDKEIEKLAEDEKKSIGIWYVDTSLHKIGDIVEENEAVCEVVKRNYITGEVMDRLPVKATIKGCVRGLIANGYKIVSYRDNFKLGDIDPRCDPSYCGKISDKARCLSGTSLEVILNSLPYLEALKAEQR